MQERAAALGNPERSQNPSPGLSSAACSEELPEPAVTLAPAQDARQTEQGEFPASRLQPNAPERLAISLPSQPLGAAWQLCSSGLGGSEWRTAGRGGREGLLPHQPPAPKPKQDTIPRGPEKKGSPSTAQRERLPFGEEAMGALTEQGARSAHAQSQPLLHSACACTGEGTERRAGGDPSLLGHGYGTHCPPLAQKPCALLHGQRAWLERPRLPRILPRSLAVNTRREFPSVARAGSRLRHLSCKQKLGWEELVDSEACFFFFFQGGLR